MKVLVSKDLGKKFRETKSAPAFPADDGRALANIWSLEEGTDKKDLWCGVEPASLFRSSDGGDSWELITSISNHDHARQWHPGNDGLPSDFGFPIVVHPHNPDVVYVVPLEPTTRTCPGAKPAVWRSENGGKSWKRLANGLPKKDSFFTVLRDAMTFDTLKTPSLYFGTTTGQLWLGRNGGEDWTCVFDALPPINCVKVAVV